MVLQIGNSLYPRRNGVLTHVRRPDHSRKRHKSLLTRPRDTRVASTSRPTKSKRTAESLFSDKTSARLHNGLTTAMSRDMEAGSHVRSGHKHASLIGRPEQKAKSASQNESVCRRCVQLGLAPRTSPRSPRSRDAGEMRSPQVTTGQMLLVMVRR